VFVRLKVCLLAKLITVAHGDAKALPAQLALAHPVATGAAERTGVWFYEDEDEEHGFLLLSVCERGPSLNGYAACAISADLVDELEFYAAEAGLRAYPELAVWGGYFEQQGAGVFSGFDELNVFDFYTLHVLGKEALQRSNQ